MDKGICANIYTNKALPKIVPLVEELGVQWVRFDILSKSGLLDDIISAFKPINVNLIGIPDIASNQYVDLVKWCATKGIMLQIGNEMDDPYFAEHWNNDFRENFTLGIQACKDAGAKSLVNVSWGFFLDSVLPYMQLADAVGLDVYTCNLQLLRTRLQTLRRIGKPVYVTEFNMEMDEYTPEKQAETVVQLLQAFYEEKVEVACYYSLQDHSDWTGHYEWGVVDTDWNRKPVFDALKNFKPHTHIGLASLHL
jgi:hypothetical protein